MLLTDLHFLCCLRCKTDIAFKKGTVENERIINGILICPSCQAEYPVLREVAIFFRPHLINAYLDEEERLISKDLGMALDLIDAPESKGSPLQLKACHNWEFQWQRLNTYDEAQLSQNNGSWLGADFFWKCLPLAADDIDGKVIFIGCGGRGREAFHINKRNPRKIIVNEIGHEIYSLRKLFSRHADRLLLIRGDLKDLPLKENSVDVSLCDHALQHIDNHKQGFKSLAQVVTKGGKIAVCVYSHEHNMFMTKIIEPLKIVIRRLPVQAIRWLALLPAIILYVILKIIYQPTYHSLPCLFRLLPLSEHMLFWSRNDFRSIWTICFDLIHAPISYHFRRQEMLLLAEDNELIVNTLINTHQTLWSMVALKPNES